MASIHRQKGRANWYCAFTDASGKRHFRSTGVKDKLEAKQISNNIELAVRESRAGTFNQSRARKLIEDTFSLIKSSSGDDLNKNLISEFFTNWLADIKTRITLSTYQSYSGITKAFLKFLGKKADQSITQLQLHDIKAYRDDAQKVLASGTVNNHMRMLRLALDSAIEQDIIDKNPAKAVKNIVRVDKQLRRPFTIDELRKVLGAAPEEWKTAVLVGFYTGLRLGDVANLKWDDIDLKKGEYSVTTKKTGRQVISALAHPLLCHLRLLEKTASNHYVCGRLAGVITSKLSIEFNGILCEAGLLEKTKYRNYKAEGKRRKYSGLSFHCLRHTTTSALKNTGTTSAVAGDIVGHDSEAMQRNCTKIDVETKRQALDQLPDLLG